MCSKAMLLLGAAAGSRGVGRPPRGYPSALDTMAASLRNRWSNSTGCVDLSTSTERSLKASMCTE